MSNVSDYGSIVDSTDVVLDSGDLTASSALFFNHIRIALEARLDQLDDLDNVAYENVEIDLSTLNKGTAGIEFVQAFILPQATETLSHKPLREAQS